MIETNVIGVGAAGNKAAIALLEAGVLAKNQILLINSTLKDIDTKYHDISIELEGLDGCAKERKIAKKMMRDNLDDKASPMNKINVLAEKDDLAFVTIVCSAEGGTGSGASIELARYIYEELGQYVHLSILCGFEDDGQGLKNTLEWFKDVAEADAYTVDAISNKKFLAACKGNKRKAEEAANREFVERIKILLGKKLLDGTDNIDDMDLTRITQCKGYMDILHGEFDRPSSLDEFSSIVDTIIANSKSYPSDDSCEMSAVMLHRNEKIADSINYAEDNITYTYGEPFRRFTHTQDSESENWIDIIISGRNLPLDIIKDINDEFQAKRMAHKNRNKLTSDAFEDFDTDDEELETFNRRPPKKKKTGSFTNTNKTSTKMDEF